MKHLPLPRAGRRWLPVTWRLRERLQRTAERSRRYSQRNFKLMGYITALTLPPAAYLEQLVADPAFNALYIRCAAAALGVVFILHDRLPTAVRRHMEWLWIGSLTFVLPFTFGFMLTLNAASTPAGVSPSPIWVYEYIVALFIFIQLVNHGPLAAALWALSSVAVLACCLFVDAPNGAALREAWLYPLPVYLTALIVGSVTNRNIHVVQTEQLRAASAIGSNIAHELRTPLASIRVLAQGIGRRLPPLLDAYGRATSAGLAVTPLADRQLEALQARVDSIEAEVGYSNTIIDMLLANTSESSVSAEAFEAFPISAAIEEAVTRFPFNNSSERDLVSHQVDGDFTVVAPRPFVVHVLFNLIKNGLYFVQKAGRGELRIVARTQGDTHVVEVTDTGTGIAASLQPLIFDRFFSADPASQGAGIGLSFCRMVMESIGGRIACQSREGEYTSFQLTFPPPPERRVATQRAEA